jgi:hypothetical protein
MKAFLSPLSPAVTLANLVRAILVVSTSMVSMLMLSPHSAVAKERSSLSREPDAIYLEDFLDKPVRLKIKKDSSPPVFSQLNAKLRVGRMVAGSTVTVVAVSEKAYRVRGKATHGGVSGWMSPKYLEAKDPEFFEKMKKVYARQLEVQTLIDAHEVGLGMTVDEVKESLGKPTTTKSTIEKDSKLLILEYTTFERVAQRVARRDQYGRLYYDTTFVKVPVGTLAVHFLNGAATRIEEEIGEPKDGVKIVPLPIQLF